MGFGGFMKGLGKGLLGAGGIIAAPFTGGASLMGTLGAIGSAAAPVIGGMAGGRAEGKQAEQGAAFQRAQLEQQLFDRAMQRHQTEAQMPTMRARQNMLGDLMANAQPGKTRFTTGLNHMTQGSRAGGNKLMELAMARMGNEQLPQLPGMPADKLKGGALDNILGIGGAVSSLLGALPQKQSPVMYGQPGVGVLPGGPGSIKPVKF